MKPSVLSSVLMTALSCLSGKEKQNRDLNCVMKYAFISHGAEKCCHSHRVIHSISLEMSSINREREKKKREKSRKKGERKKQREKERKRREKV